MNIIHNRTELEANIISFLKRNKDYITEKPKDTGSSQRPRGRALALPTSDYGVAFSNPAGGEILPETKRRFTASIVSK